MKPLLITLAFLLISMSTNGFSQYHKRTSHKRARYPVGAQPAYLQWQQNQYGNQRRMQTRQRRMQTRQRRLLQYNWVLGLNSLIFKGLKVEFQSRLSRRSGLTLGVYSVGDLGGEKAEDDSPAYTEISAGYLWHSSRLFRGFFLHPFAAYKLSKTAGNDDDEEKKQPALGIGIKSGYRYFIAGGFSLSGGAVFRQITYPREPFEFYMDMSYAFN
jgi:hypothetical protein